MRLRLLLSFSLIILVSVVGVVVIAARNTTTAVRAFMYRGGMIGQGGLAQELEAYYQSHGSWQGAGDLLQAGRGHGPGMMGGMMNQRLRLADAHGVLMSDSAAAPVGSLTRSQRRDAIPLIVNGQTVGYLLAEGGMNAPLREERFLVNRLTSAAVTAALIAGGLALLLSLLLADRLMQPVRLLTGAARRLGEGDLSQRVEIEGWEELSVLAQTFNRMADSLQQAEESRRVLTADIAHELRNPLAVQRANLEALQDGVYDLSPAALEPALEQNRLLTRLVDDLRTLALADAGELKLERARIDFDEWLARLLERFRPQADAQQVELLLKPSPAPAGPLVVSADPLRVEQILNNVLSNALRFTPEGGHITLETAKQADRAVVSVHDSGPGIPAEALPHLFERFYRADRGRSRTGGGSGLGLAIARNLAEAHSGSLTAANHPQGGAVFTLSLPLA